MNSFSVQVALMCDFATQDAGGKPILVGVQYGDIRFDGEPKFFPPCFIHVVVVANSAKFSFSVKFLNPEDEDIFTVTSNFDSKDYPLRGESIIVNVQIPPIKFTSEGLHNLVVYDESGLEIYRRKYAVFCTTGDQFSAELSGSVSFNPKFQRKKVK